MAEWPRIDVRPDRQYQILCLDPQLLVDWLQFLSDDLHWRTRFTVTPPLPDDLRVVAVREDWWNHRIEILLWSAKFPPVPINETPPTIRLAITRHD